MSTWSWERAPSWLLPVIVTVYLILGILFAVYTPAWQAPDEPAHYNYVQYLARQHRFPVLKLGDYPAAYLEEIKAAHFPPEMSIAPIRYEFHQPPLYYLLAVPVYTVFGGKLLPLRLFSLLLGAVLLLVVHRTVRELTPHRPYLALGTTAFVAFLPMHLAMTAVANNDTLAELLLAMVLLLTIRYLKIPTAAGDQGTETRFLVLLGITTGLGLVTKSYIYVTLPLVLLTIAARFLWLDQGRASFGAVFRAAAVYLLPAVALALPWWLRNLALYGGADFLGLGRHNEVVVGQLRTAEFIAAHGPARLVQDWLLTSFRSFWGQFGWMGVLLDQRLYLIMAILSALAAIGFGLWAIGAWRRRGKYQQWQWAAAAMLTFSLLATAASYIWYNTQFVQHQGRYLFAALLPIGLAVALGWRESLRRRWALPLAALLFATAAILGLVLLRSRWILLLCSVASIAFVIRRFLPYRWSPAVHAVPYVLLILLDLTSLFFFVVPQLAL